MNEKSNLIHIEAFSDVQRMLRKAIRHIENFDREIRIWFETNPYTMEDRDILGYPGYRDRIYKLDVPFPEILDEEAGSAVSALCSALDYTIFALNRLLDLGRPIASLAYPHGQTAERFEEELCKKLKSFPDEVLCVVRSTNAYESGQFLFRALFNLRNVAAHRHFLTLPPSLGGIIFHEVKSQGVDWYPLRGLFWNAETKEVLIGRLYPGATIETYKVDVTPIPTFSEPALANKDALMVLGHMCQNVGNVCRIVAETALRVREDRAASPG